MNRRRTEYEDGLAAALEDGQLTAEEERDLMNLHERLGLNDDEVEQLTRASVKNTLLICESAPIVIFRSSTNAAQNLVMPMSINAVVL